MLKILYISNSRLPTEKAHGKQIMETCSALANQEVDVKLVVPRRFNPIENDIFDFYGIKKNFSIHKIACLDLLSLPLIHWTAFIIESATFALSALWHAIWSKDKFDILYTRDFIIAGLFSFGARPVFYEVHNLPNKVRRWHRWIWRRCQGLIVISEGLRKELIKYKINQDKILLARDGVDIDKFNLNIAKQEAREKLNLPAAKKIAVYTGHLYSWKGADLLAEAAAKLPFDIEVYLVGGTEKDVAMFREKYQAPNLHIIGHRSEQEMPLWLKSADALVLPNRSKEKISAQYTSPLKLFEYMASGTPIVASDLPSIREVVNENEVIFFKADNMQSLADAIKDVIINKKDQKKSVNVKVQQYSWDKRAERILNFINQNI